tara:strand:- start:17077 stop:17823 length:747 start_codon:yes stop_codon:yes gene_type:complete
MKITAVILAFLLSLTSMAQVSRNVFTNNSRTVVGQDNTRLVDANMLSIPFKYRDIAESVGLMSMGCTATHIGNGLVISAGHCFEEGKIARYRSICGGIQVFWNVREGRQPSGVSNCRQLLVLELNNQKDYALFRVDNPPRSAVKIRLSGRPALGTRVTIFSHPFKNPLTWSGTCEIRRALNFGLPLHAIHHTCDTNPGSSGAAIIDAMTLEVVGIHGGGVSVGSTGANYATYIDWTYIPAVLQRLGYR